MCAVLELLFVFIRSVMGVCACCVRRYTGTVFLNARKKCEVSSLYVVCMVIVMTQRVQMTVQQVLDLLQNIDGISHLLFSAVGRTSLHLKWKHSISAHRMLDSGNSILIISIYVLIFIVYLLYNVWYFFSWVFIENKLHTPYTCRFRK